MFRHFRLASGDTCSGPQVWAVRINLQFRVTGWCRGPAAPYNENNPFNYGPRAIIYAFSPAFRQLWCFATHTRAHKCHNICSKNVSSTRKTQARVGKSRGKKTTFPANIINDNGLSRSSETIFRYNTFPTRVQYNSMVSKRAIFFLL